MAIFPHQQQGEERTDPHFNRSGTTVSRILSYAPARKHLRKFRERTEIEWYNPTHTDYSGLLVVSSLNGILSHAINFEEGHCEYIVRPRLHNHLAETRAVATDSLQLGTNNSAEASMSFFNMRTVTSEASIRSYSYDDETYEVPGCMFCGGDPYTCTCLEIVVCEECGYDPDNCTCKCIICNENPCTCEYCDTCHNLKEDCICSDSPSEGGASNGNSGNGGTTGGGASGGGSSSGGSGGSSSSEGIGSSAGNGGGSAIGEPSVNIIGGTIEQQTIIDDIVQSLAGHGLVLNGVTITIVENGCAVLARIAEGYTGIEICQSFFSYLKEEQMAIMWHEAYHWLNDNRSWENIANYNISPYNAVPPTNIEAAIRYLIEIVDEIPKKLYDSKSGQYINNPEWDIMYYYRTLIFDFKNPIYTQNEINAYNAEIEAFPNVSERYNYERMHILWQHLERLKNY